jgi:hypothetical protein
LATQITADAPGAGEKKAVLSFSAALGCSAPVKNTAKKINAKARNFSP